MYIASLLNDHNKIATAALAALSLSACVDGRGPARPVMRAGVI